MKKTLLTLVALLATTCGFAQENLAVGGTATASTEAYNHYANYAIDGIMSTRWESAENDNQYWTLDMGEAKTFNTVQIAWEPAYSKTFTLSVSNDGVDYTEVAYIADQVLDTSKDFEGSKDRFCTRNYNVGEQTARYIKFTNIARATAWGVSFWEFRVYELEAPKFTSIALEAASAFVRLGAEVALTAQGKDQLGNDFEAGPFEYEVTPADAGTVEDGVFKTANRGDATIVAKCGDIVSNPVKVSAYTGDKLDIFAEMKATLTPINDETLTAYSSGPMANAFDDNMSTLWQLHNESGEDEASRTYTCGFQLDFESLWDITAITATYEGACPEDYQIIAIDAYGDETVLQDVTGHEAWLTYTDYLAFRNLIDVRSIRWISTKAATKWSVKIYDFSVYGENMHDQPTAIAAVQGAVSAKAMFNIAGQRVSQPQGGLYIVDGKKVVVK